MLLLRGRILVGSEREPVLLLRCFPLKSRTKFNINLSKYEERRTDTIDEDAEPVSLCKEGNVDAFEVLVGKYQKKMLNIAYRMIGNYEDACEIVQDTFVSAYKGIKNFEEKARFSTWLYTIVMNLSRNRLSQLKIQSGREAFSIDDPVGADDAGIK